MKPLNNYTDTKSLPLFLGGLADCVKRRFHHMSGEEQQRVEQELEVAFNKVGQAQSVNELMVQVAQPFEPVFKDVETCLERIHAVAGYGTLASCLSSRHIVEALFDFGLCNEFGATNDNLVIGRGHIAPLIYAHRYLRRGIPLCFLMALHEDVPAVVRNDFGFSYSMRHSLGEGIGIAVGRAYTHQDERIVCFSGDGELNEGTSFETIRLVSELDIKNLTLVVDANGRGIDPLPKPLNIGYLQAYFDQVWELDGHDSKALHRALDNTLTCGESVALVCHTLKEGHSYRRPDVKKSGAASCCSQIAGITQALSKNTKSHVFTADLAARFGLKPEHQFVNVGLAESSLLSTAMGCPSEDLKFVLTDDKYYLNALDMMHSAMISSRNLHIVAARKNGVWGGPTYVPSLFSAMSEDSVYELTDPEHLHEIIADKHSRSENGLYLMYDQSMDNIQTLREQYSKTEPFVYLRRCEDASCLLISSESMACFAFERMQEMHASHLRFLEVRPELSEEVSEFIRSFAKVIVLEHNTQRGGLADYLESSLLIRVQRVFSEAYEWPGINTFQSGVAPKLIRQLGSENEKSI